MFTIINSGSIAGGTGNGGQTAIAFTGGSNFLTTNSGGSYTGAISISNASSGSLTLLQTALGGATGSAAYATVFTGTGSLHCHDGSSYKVTLSGANTYTGGTALTSGTLVVGNDSALGTGALDMAAGTTLSFRNAGNFTLANNITISGDPTFTPPAGTVQTLSGVIADGSSPGTLDMAGAGTLVLSGINTYTGATNVNAGTLEVDGSIATSSLTTVNSGGLLTGTGTLGNTQINAGGTFAPGASGVAGTSTTVNGNLVLSSGSFYAVTVSPTLSSNTIVNGTAALGGATVVATLTGQFGLYSARTYTILSANNVSGTFNPVITFSSSGLTSAQQLVLQGSSSLSYDANDVNLSLLTPAYAITLALPPNAPANAQNVGHRINDFIRGGGTLPAGFQNLAGLSGAGLNNAVNQLGGQSQGSAAPVGFSAGTMFLNLMLNPYIEGRGGPSGSGFGGSGFGPAMAYAPEPAASPAASAFSALALGPPRTTFSPQLSFWATGYGGSGTISGNATTGAANTTSQIYGFASGADYRVTPDTAIGFALGGGGSNWSLGQGMGGGNAGLFQAGLYGTTHMGPAYVSGALSYALQDVNTARTVTLVSLDPLHGHFDANVASGRIESGYRLPYGLFAMTPYGAVQTQAMFLPSYAEYASFGSPQFALNYMSRTFTATRTELGAWFDSDRWIDKGIKLYSRLAWAHDFDNEGSSTAFFQSLPGESFIVNSAKPAHDGALVTAGFEYRLGDGWSMLGKFDGEFSPTTSIFAGTASIKKVW